MENNDFPPKNINIFYRKKGLGGNQWRKKNNERKLIFLVFSFKELSVKGKRKKRKRFLDHVRNLTIFCFGVDCKTFAEILIKRTHQNNARTHRKYQQMIAGVKLCYQKKYGSVACTNGMT